MEVNFNTLDWVIIGVILLSIVEEFIFFRETPPHVTNSSLNVARPEMW